MATQQIISRNNQGKKLVIFFFSLFIYSSVSFNGFSQVTLTVRINSGTSNTTCDDGAFGTPDPAYRVRIAGQAYSMYPSVGACTQNTPFTQYSESFNCNSSYPSVLLICFRPFENDGTSCGPAESCLVQMCQNYPTPSAGSSATYTMVIPNNGSNASWGSINFTITASGSFLAGTSNDLICGAINMGTLNLGGTLGNNSLSNYGNFCATSASDPSPWGGGNDQGVWFRFTTGSTLGSEITLDATSDPQGLGDVTDLQLALYSSSNGACTGSLTLVQDSYNGAGSIEDESVTVNCLLPNTTYYLLLDGEATAVNPNGQDGYFGLEISDNGIRTAGDEICDAENLGAVPASGSTTTGVLNRTNECAAITNDPIPSTWGIDQTVWFQFTAPATGSVDIDVNSSGIDPIDLQLALYSSDNGTCSGTLTEIQTSYTAAVFDEEMSVTCLSANANYFLMIDGSSLGVNGTFDVTISDPGTGCPLPVNFIDFQGISDGETHTLFWSTASEQNNDYFTIESSLTKDNFEILTQIKGAGNSQSTNQYSIINRNTQSETRYYRLSQTDYDGRREFLKTIALKNNGVENIGIVPNPVSSEALVVFNSSFNTEGYLSVYNSYGNSISEEKIQLSKGRNEVTLQTVKLNKGIYYVRIVGELVNIQTRFIKL